MDGWITIGTKLDTDKFDAQITELENKIKQEEQKQQVNIEVRTQLEEEQAGIVREAERLTKEYEKAANEADRLSNILRQTKAGSYQNYEAAQQYETQAKKVDELYLKLEQVHQQESKINEKIAKNNIQYQASVDKVGVLNGKIASVNAKSQQLLAKEEQIRAKEQEIQFKEAQKGIENMKKSITGAIGQIGKMGLALLSIRSAYSMIRQASSTIAQYNKQYATDLEYMKFVLAQGIAPVLEKVVLLAQTLMAYINYLATRLLGINLFANGSADAFKKAKDNLSGAAKSSKELKNNLAGFDELNVLDKDNGNETLTPSVDIGGLENVEIPEWLEKLGDILEPIGKMLQTAATNLKQFFDTITASTQGLWSKISPIITKISNGFMSLWNDAIKPAVTLISGILNDLWAGLKAAWEKWGQPIVENVKAAIEWIGTIMTTLWNSILLPIWQHLVEVLTKLWDEHLKPLWDNLLDFFGELINGALEIWNKVLAPLINWLIEKLSPIIVGVVNTIIDIVGQVLGTITDVINAIITILKGIVEFIVGVFTGDWDKAWQGVKDIFQGIWDGITAIVKGAINIIITFINGMIAGIEKALNWIVDKINSLQIVNPFTGEDIWSPNVPKFTFGRIPTLARGGIVARPTQAVIGEAGREAVMPLDNNTEWMDILAEKLGTRTGDNITIRFTGTASQLVRMLKPELDKEDKRTGKKLIVGGAY